VTSSLPAGPNNIGDVDILSVIPGTAATNLGKAEDTLHTTGDVGVMGLAVRNDADLALAGTDLDYIPLSTDALGRLRVNPVAFDVVDFLDTNPVLDTSTTNIPASSGSPLTAVASLAAAVKKIKTQDTTGFYIGIYTGAAASEVLQLVSGPGEDGIIDVAMAAGERVSLRHMKNTAISTGEYCLQFIG